MWRVTHKTKLFLKGQKVANCYIPYNHYIKNDWWILFLFIPNIPSKFANMWDGTHGPKRQNEKIDSNWWTLDDHYHPYRHCCLRLPRLVIHVFGYLGLVCIVWLIYENSVDVILMRQAIATFNHPRVRINIDSII